MPFGFFPLFVLALMMQSEDGQKLQLPEQGTKLY
jgi:hypothetical protein